MTRLESISDILLDDDGATGSVDKPRACISSATVNIEGIMRHLTLLHLADELLVEQTTRLLVKRAVDRDNVALRQHFFEVLNPSAANLLLLLRRQGLIVEVQQFLAVEWLQAAKHPFADTANSNGTNNLVLQVILVLGYGSDIPVAGSDLLVRRDEVADQDEDGHDDVLGNRDDVRAGDLCHGDAAISLVSCVQVDVVGPNASSDGKLELLCLREALCRQITRVEAGEVVSEQHNYLNHEGHLAHTAS